MSDAKQNAAELEKAGRLPEALSVLEAEARTDRSPSLLLELGRLQMVTGLLEQAENTLREAIDGDNTWAMPKFLLGFVLHDQGRPIEAIEIIEAGLAQEDWPRARTVLGEIYSQLGRISEGRRQLELALAKDESNSETWYTLALIYREVDPARVVSLLEKAIAVDPTDGNAHRELGLERWKEGEAGTAEHHLRTATSVASDDGWAHTYLGALLSEQGRFQEGERESRLAVACLPDAQLPLCTLGDCLAKQGDWTGAEASYLRALELDVNHYLPNLRLGQLMERRGRPSKATRYFERALQADVGNRVAIAALARLSRAKDET